jgi:hypothetical protein
VKVRAIVASVVPFPLDVALVIDKRRASTVNFMGPLENF